MSCCLEGRAENEAGPDLQVKKERTMGEGGVIGKDQELLSLRRWVPPPSSQFLDFSSQRSLYYQKPTQQKYTLFLY